MDKILLYGQSRPPGLSSFFSIYINLNVSLIATEKPICGMTPSPSSSSTHHRQSQISLLESDCCRTERWPLLWLQIPSTWATDDGLAQLLSESLTVHLW